MGEVYQVKIGRRGVITLPKKLRDQKNLESGEILILIELSDDVFVISRDRSRVDKVADQLAEEWLDSGETLETMLSTLREARTAREALDQIGKALKKKGFTLNEMIEDGREIRSKLTEGEYGITADE